jgi:hypothetical protein
MKRQHQTNETSLETSSLKRDRESSEQDVDNFAPSKRQRVESHDEGASELSSCELSTLNASDACADEQLPLDCMDNFFCPMYVLKSHVLVKRKETGEVVIELAWIDGQNRELLHQLMQYLKNQFM